jgi:hypothetical protein
MFALVFIGIASVGGGIVLSILTIKKQGMKKANKTLILVGVALMVAVGVVVAIPGVTFSFHVGRNVIEDITYKQTLESAIQQSDVDRVRFLLENGADSNKLVSEEYSETVLFRAVSRARYNDDKGIEIIELLLLYSLTFRLFHGIMKG